MSSLGKCKENPARWPPSHMLASLCFLDCIVAAEINFREPKGLSEHCIEAPLAETVRKMPKYHTVIMLYFLCSMVSLPRPRAMAVQRDSVSASPNL